MDLETFDLALFHSYKAATDPATAKRLRDLLIMQNLPFVARVVKAMMRCSSKEKEDALQAGALGLMKAIEKFDPDLGEFYSYAKRWVRDEVHSDLLHQSRIRRSRWSAGLMPFTVRRQIERIRSLHNREATADELGVTQDQLSEWVPFHFEPVEDGDTVGHLTVERHQLSANGASPQAIVERQQVLELVRAAFDRLPIEDRELAHALFIDERTYTDVASEWNMYPAEISWFKKRVIDFLQRALRTA